MDLNPARTAIIAVHFQGDIVSADGAFGKFFADEAASRDVVGTTSKLLDAARATGATAVYTRVAFQPGYTDMVANLPLLTMVSQTRCLLDGNAKAEILAEVAPKDGDLVITHQRLGGFSDSGLDTLLRSRGIDTVLLTGVATNLSVEGIARQASDLGYRTIVVADACSAADEAAHSASLGTLGLLAEIVSSGDVIDALTGAPSSVAATA
jgi:nicotinamidase-related amidase